jgi:Icc-related predicted phosphoesterase
MKLLLVSDLHIEKHFDSGKTVIEELIKDVDVLVAAGDITVAGGIPDALKLICESFSRIPVIYLPGNHEYYTATREQVQEHVAKACSTYKNLHWLRAGHPVTIDGQRFIGGSLFFPKHPTAPKKAINDFKLIPKFESWVYAENKATVKFLHDEVNENDVVVTHYLPSQRSVSVAWRGSVINPFFVCDMDRFIQVVQPKLWLHGHTHTSCNYEIGKTRIVCNPFGYPDDLNEQYNPKLVIEVP